MIRETVAKWKDGKNGAETFFKDFCREDKTKGTMTKAEFLAMIKDVFPSLTKLEQNHMY